MIVNLCPTPRLWFVMPDSNLGPDGYPGCSLLEWNFFGFFMKKYEKKGGGYFAAPFCI